MDITVEQHLHHLQQLSAHPGWKLYLQLLQDAHQQLLPQLKAPISTPQEMMAHNRTLGLLEGIEKCLVLVPTLIQQLEKE